MFRQTLLVHQSAPVQRAIDDRTLSDLLIASAAQTENGQFVTPHGVSMTTSDPLVAAAMHELADCSPAALPFAKLAARAGRRLGLVPLPAQDEHQLRALMLDAYLARMVELFSCALPATARPSRYPTASPLARAQAAAGLTVLSTLASGNCILDQEAEARFLPLLDGTRDHNTLARELGASPDAVQQALLALTRHGLLSS